MNTVTAKKKKTKTPKKSLSFGRHETFHIRTGWLKKGYDAINTKDSSLFFYQTNASDILGVGKNMVLSIKYWCTALNIIELFKEKNQYHYFTTDFSKFLFKYDEYLEDPASNWLLHYNLISSFENAPTWFYAFYKLSLKDFNKNSFTMSFKLFLKKYSGLKETSDKTLDSDFLALIRTYCERLGTSNKTKEDVLDSPFANLELIAPENDNLNFRFKVGPKNNLPSEVIAYSIYQFIKKNKNIYNGSSIQINIDKLMWEPYSPGMAFKLDTETLIHYIEDICNKKLLGHADYSTTAGIKQILITNFEDISIENILQPYFERN